MEKNYRVKIRKRRKQLFVDRFGGKCEVCGYNKCLNALEFHHLDPTKKEYSPTEVMNLSIEKAEKELSKCILVCSNCHAEIHSEDYDFNFKFIVKDWTLVKCEFCGKEFNTKKENRIFCSEKCSQLSQRKVINRPTKEELTNLILQFTYVDIGKKFNVSDVAVRKWAKNYKII